MKRDHIKRLCCTPGESDTWEAAARDAGFTFSEWARRRLSGLPTVSTGYEYDPGPLVIGKPVADTAHIAAKRATLGERTGDVYVEAADIQRLNAIADGDRLDRIEQKRLSSLQLGPSPTKPGQRLKKPKEKNS